MRRWGRYRLGVNPYINVLQAIVDWGDAVSSEAQAYSIQRRASPAAARNWHHPGNSRGSILRRAYGSIGPFGRLFPDVCYPSSMRPTENDPLYPRQMNHLRISSNCRIRFSSSVSAGRSTSNNLPAVAAAARARTGLCGRCRAAGAAAAISMAAEQFGKAGDNLFVAQRLDRIEPARSSGRDRSRRRFPRRRQTASRRSRPATKQRPATRCRSKTS